MLDLEQSAEFSSSLWSCRKRAICPLSSDVFSTSPNEPAVSKSSRWSFVGIVFHCMMMAAPRAAKNVLLNLCNGIFVKTFPNGFVLRAINGSFYRNCPPARVSFCARSLKLRFERCKSRISLGGIGVFECFGVFRRFCSKLLGCEHGTLLRDTEGGCPLKGAVMSAYWVLLTYMGTIRSNCDGYLPAQPPKFEATAPCPPVVAAIHPPYIRALRSEKVVQTG